MREIVVLAVEIFAGIGIIGWGLVIIAAIVEAIWHREEFFRHRMWF